MEELQQNQACGRSGDASSSSEMLAQVYQELRSLAASRMARESPGQTLQATALVHEAWLQIAGAGDMKWESRAHFFGAASEAMRRILVDVARRSFSRRVSVAVSGRGFSTMDFCGSVPEFHIPSD